MVATIAKTLVVFFWILLVGYAGRLLAAWADVSSTEMTAGSLISLIAVILLGIYRILLVALPRITPLNRRWLIVVGVAMIILAELFLQDSPENFVFLQDLIKVLGVFLVIVWPMKLLVNQKAAEAKFNEKVEIIEV